MSFTEYTLSPKRVTGAAERGQKVARAVEYAGIMVCTRVSVTGKIRLSAVHPEVVPMSMRVFRRTVRISRATVPALLAVALVAGYATSAAAQGTTFVPYFGKNLIHYDKFEWHI